MKIIKSIREELNVTQEEMATLLNISRSQWALYEIGLRELSTTGLINESRASLFLSVLDSHDHKKDPNSNVLESERTKFIADELRKNEFNLIACERKIDKIVKNYNAALKLYQLTDFFLQSKGPENTQHSAALEILKTNANKALVKNSPK